MKIIFSLLGILLTGQLFAQQLTIEHLHSWTGLNTTEKEIKTLLVINGILIIPEEYEETLQGLDISKDKISIDAILRKDAINALYMNLRIDAIISVITHNTQLRKKQILNHLKEFRERIPKPLIKTHHINDALKQPVLLIDGVPIQHNEAGKVLSNLKARHIFNMAYVSRAPMEYYGQNAKNGLIQIWLKK